MRNNIFKVLLNVAGWVGNIHRASMHNEDFMIIEGTTADGREFHICLNVQKKKEEEKDGN